MTVAELIEELQKFEPSMRVVTFCHYGYNDIKRVNEQRIALDVYHNEATHDQVDDREDYPDHLHVDAVAII